MRKILLTILGLLIVGLYDANSQSKEIHLGDTIVIIERLTLTEADNRKVERIQSAMADNGISENWDADGFRNQDKRLEKDYEKIIAGLNKKKIKFRELTQKEFMEHVTSGADKVVYLATDYSVREWKNVLVVATTFKLSTADKKLLLDKSAKGILKQISGI